ncbi:L-alanine-DL-glutamate epimerase-like enolase superfamily enzyme [Neobacillus niacini]|uniref:mandelate racemase/muconate lactonizing enzyme family protein n=1 Tax=Neobacillus niacini TaxID=86668 RepID=UPI00277F466D|nr:dipeptide epimerase [Neobacillus niacini]MDQ1005501.1 L-alanine-DL-glutamate epimerase-like enolase superfamily enzyme [Neobacillus niacini]
MYITKVEAKIVRTPLNVPFKMTYGEMPPYQSHLIVRITTNTGLTGLGEASELPFFTGETVETMKVLVEKKLGPAIIGKLVYSLRDIHHAMGIILGNATGAKSAIDMALWDVQGKRLKTPVYELLGGERKPPVRVAYVLGDESPEEMARAAKERADAGFDTLKIKIGSDFRKDIEAISQIRQAIGPAVHLRIDANQGYHVKTAIQVIKEIEPYKIDYIEQPVPGWNYDGLRQIRSASSIPIMADESAHTLKDIYELAKKEAIDLVGIKLIKCGGITPAIQIAQFSEAIGLQCVLISPWDTLLGTFASLHLSTILPGNYSHEMVGPYYLKDDPFGVVDIKGVMEIPNGIGLGMEDIFDEIVEEQ